MKVSKILAGIAAMAIAGTMAVSASAETDYLYLVQASWTGKAPTDSVEGTVKFTDKTAKGACDLNEWDTGSDKYNGEWAQFILTSDDLSSVSISFTVKSTENSLWEAHTYDDSKPAEDQVYQVFLTLDQTETVPYETITQPDWQIETVTDEDGNIVYNDDGSERTKVVNNNTMTATCVDEWTYTYGSDVIEAAIDNNKAQLSENEDGTYTLGFNIQVGHVGNALVTGTVTADNLYTGAEGGNSSNTSSDNNSSNASSTTSSSSSAASTTSKTTTTTGTTTTTSTAASSTASDNTNAGTGATAGIALAGLALAGAAAVVSKRK